MGNMIKPCKTCDHAIFCQIWGEIKCKIFHRRMKNGGPDSCKHYLKTVTDDVKCQCESCLAAAQEENE